MRFSNGRCHFEWLRVWTGQCEPLYFPVLCQRQICCPGGCQRGVVLSFVTVSDCLLSLLAGQTCRPTSVARWIESRPAVCTHGPGLLFATSAKKPRKLVHGVVDISSLCFPWSESSKLDVLLLRCASYLSVEGAFRTSYHGGSLWVMSFLQMAGHRDGEICHILQRCSIPFLRS